MIRNLEPYGGYESPRIPRFSTGLRGENQDTVNGRKEVLPPLSLAWVTDDLLDKTIEVWSEAYGRQISEEEAIEILMNVKRMGELLIQLRKESLER